MTGAARKRQWPLHSHAGEVSRRLFHLGLFASIALSAIGVLPGESQAQSSRTTVSELAKTTHFHGLGVDPDNPDRLLLATHHGVYTVQRSGNAERLSRTRDDFMGFASHPTDRSIFLASGHPVGGGNLGLIASRDGGRTWEKLSDGVGGPVDFHQLTISPADPNVMYGVFGGIQQSSDGGQTWRRVGNAPEGLIDLTASSVRTNSLYAATQTGILRSGDGGRNWRPSYANGAPTTLIHTTAGGVVYAYVIGQGFIRSAERERGWATLNPGLGARYLLHLAEHPTNPDKLFAIASDRTTNRPSIVQTDDGGVTWASLTPDEE